MTWTLDKISPESATNLHGLLLERAKRSTNSVAYKYFDSTDQCWKEYTWAQVVDIVTHWATALSQLQLNIGERVGVMLPNGPEWVFFEQAAARAGLVSVPLYPNDRPDNVSHIVNESEIRVLFFWGPLQWDTIRAAKNDFENTPVFISSQPVNDPEVTHKSEWLKKANGLPSLAPVKVSSKELATIVYTSGTTGRPKGVMLSHDNIIKNAFFGVHSVDVYKEDLFLSFLPLSHTLERTVGYYLPMLCGASVAYCRSIPELAEDLLSIKPTVLISVPRIFERVYGKIKTGLQEKSPVAQKLFAMAISVGWEKFLAEQGRGSRSLRQVLWPLLNKLVASKIAEKLGGRLRFAISGGAPLPKEIAETFIGLGIQILQGYGLTESSPVISVNKMDSNIPHSIGQALHGVKVRLSKDGELQTSSECVMMGYWKREDATKETFTEDGWLRTGDLARIDESNHIYITGRLKEIMVMSNGEKIPPVDIEMAITLDPLFEQAMVIGEGKPYLSAIIVLNPEAWPAYAESLGLSATTSGVLKDKTLLKEIKKRVDERMSEFPGYAQIHQITLSDEVWSDQNFLLTASLKMNRKVISERFAQEIAAMYSGH
ncbi:MAG: long-chain fatty acid--CoA ligase [Gammaproteobacteria bacterium]|nr:long-chain fatty acid--CoA ligase [Gammaproteobacteria bacterium]